MKKLLLFLAVGLTFISCKDKPVNYVLETLSANVYSGDSTQIIVNPNLDGITFHSENENIAKVSANGYVKAFIKGETDIIVKKNGEPLSNKYHVTVPARYPDYVEPCFLFGQNKQAVKDCETNVFWMEHDSQIDNIFDIWYKYDSVPYVSSVRYDFQNQKLGYISIYVKNNTRRDVFVSVLQENYVYQEKIRDTIFFFDKDNVFIVKFYDFASGYHAAAIKK